MTKHDQLYDEFLAWAQVNGFMEAAGPAVSLAFEAESKTATPLSNRVAIMRVAELMRSHKTPRDTSSVGPTEAVVISDGVHPDDLLPDGAGVGWRVAHIDIIRDGDVLATLQVTPHDILVFPSTCHDIGIARNGERASVTDRSVGIYGPSATKS